MAHVHIVVNVHALTLVHADFIHTVCSKCTRRCKNYVKNVTQQNTQSYQNRNKKTDLILYECLDSLRAHLLQLEDDVRSAVDADDNLSDVANLRQVAPVSYTQQKKTP